MLLHLLEQLQYVYGIERAVAVGGFYVKVG